MNEQFEEELEEVWYALYATLTSLLLSVTVQYADSRDTNTVSALSGLVLPVTAGGQIYRWSRSDGRNTLVGRENEDENAQR